MTLVGINWRSGHAWKHSAYNTLWCLLGCSIGDFATIFAFQLFAPETNPLFVMGIAIVNGLMTSVILETLLMLKHMGFYKALKIAFGMGLISMLGMELAMNVTDYLLVGKAALTWWSIPPSLLAGFIALWPYNYWRLKRFGKSCH